MVSDFTATPMAADRLMEVVDSLLDQVVATDIITSAGTDCFLEFSCFFNND